MNQYNTTSDNTLEIAKRNRAMLFLIMTVIALVILVGVLGIFLFSPKEDVYVGRAEVSEVRISGKVPGRITRFLVEEGDEVHIGDTLVEIYSPEVKAKKLQAQAADRAAEAFKKGTQTRSRTEIQKVAEEAWIGAKAALEAGEKAFERAKRLHDQGVIAAQKYEEAEAKVKALRATEAAAQSQYELSKKGIFTQDKATAQALVDRSLGVLAEVEAYSQESALVSPIDGIVSEIFPHRGELVGTGAPIMNIADKTSVRILFSVREDRLEHFKVGTTFTGRIPALGNESISLKVVRLKDMGTYAVWKASKPNGEIDLRTFEVTMLPIEIPSDLLPGMSIVLDEGQLKVK